MEKFILEKLYRYFEENADLLHFSTDINAQVEINFAPSGKIKAQKQHYALKVAPLMGSSTKGVKISSQKVKKVYYKGS